jgi:hypothetical protein
LLLDRITTDSLEVLPEASLIKVVIGCKGADQPLFYTSFWTEIDKTRQNYPHLDPTGAQKPERQKSSKALIQPEKAVPVGLEENSNSNRDDRIRTCDILLPKQARYQAALHPVVCIQS